MSTSKDKLQMMLQQVVTMPSLIACEALVESNPLNPLTNPPVWITSDKSTVLVSCRVVPSNQYILAKLTFPWVGNDYTFMKLPKVGEQVIVLFLHDDINSGVIVGRLHSTAEIIPTALTLDNMYRKDQFGNKETWDTDGIVIQDKSTNKVTMDTAGIDVLDKNVNEMKMANTGITIKDNFTNQIQTVTGSVTITSGSTVLTIGASGTITITAAAAVGIVCPAVNLTGGTIMVTGGDVIADGISLKMHTHNYSTPQHVAGIGPTTTPNP